jgi:hypothetical protein
VSAPLTEAVRRPAPAFAVLGVEVVRHAATPTLLFTLRVTDAELREVYTIALSTQIQIDPERRGYDEETRPHLVDLFGEPEGWAETARSFSWARVDVLVPSFAGETTFDLPVHCTYDLEVAAARYLNALPDGRVPLTFLFSGTVFYPGEDGRLQLGQVPWSCTARYRMPVEAWRRSIDAHYTGMGFVRLRGDTLERLQRRRAARAQLSFDDTIGELLDGAR